MAAIFVMSCVTEHAPDDETSGATSSALSFSAGNNTGYCGSNPSASCGQGTPLAPKQLILAFDDGLGSQTLALSSYLRSQGIRATFFVVGHCFGPAAANYPQCQQNTTAAPSAILSQVQADGHLIGSHTQDHRDLSDTVLFPAGSTGDAAIVAEVSNTDAIIAPFIASAHSLFRPPFGAWSARDESVLQASAMGKYTGPIKWDIGGAMKGQDDTLASSYGADWDCWRNDDNFGVKTTKQCGDRYLHEIAVVGRGIILMHDADYGDVSNHSLTSGKGNTIDMVKYLIEGNAPLGVVGLKAQGYTFLRADEVPDIAATFGSSSDAGTKSISAGAPDGGGSCAVNPSWQQTSYANDWWVEYTISGATTASLEVVGGQTVNLSSHYGKWVGKPAAGIPSGTQVIVHAIEGTTGAAQTQSFRYLVDTAPTTACSSAATDAGGVTHASSATNAGVTNTGGIDAGVTDAGATDAGGMCSASFDPTWSQGSGANNWWAEYAVGGSISSAYVEIIGDESHNVPLKSQNSKWVGPTSESIAKGTSVVVHATNTVGQTTQTKPFGYLSVTAPATRACTQ